MLKKKILTEKIAQQLLGDDDAVVYEPWGWSIDLCDFTAIDDAAAMRLGDWESGRIGGLSLSLNGLNSLSDTSAEYLSKVSMLELDGLTALSDKAAECLGNIDGGLSLNGLTDLSETAAASLSGLGECGSLSLNGLTSLSDTVAESLRHIEGDLSLDGLTSLSDKAAESLSKHKGTLYLNGLTSLTEAAGIVAKHAGEIELNGLTKELEAFSDSPVVEYETEENSNDANGSQVSTVLKATKEWHLIYSGWLTDAPGRCESFTEEVRYDGNDQWTVRASGSDWSGTGDGEVLEEHHDTESLVEWVITSDEMFEESSSNEDSLTDDESCEVALLGERAACLKEIAEAEGVRKCVKILEEYEAGKHDKRRLVFLFGRIMSGAFLEKVNNLSEQFGQSESEVSNNLIVQHIKNFSTKDEKGYSFYSGLFSKISQQKVIAPTPEVDVVELVGLLGIEDGPYVRLAFDFSDCPEISLKDLRKIKSEYSGKIKKLLGLSFLNGRQV